LTLASGAILKSFSAETNRQFLDSRRMSQVGQSVLCTSLNSNMSPSIGDVFKTAEMMGNQRVTGEMD